ncbi:MAG: hypothetical protein SFY92_05955 [Verrucomicrobiae bacterium]|nr:hypothetical protein [Verrucomicrobiae bacterium]
MHSLLRTCLIACTVFLLPTLPGLHAETAAKKESALESLRKAAQSTIVAGGAPASTAEFVNSGHQLDQVDNLIQNEDYRNALQTARNSMRNIRNPELRKLWEQVVAEIEKLEEERDKKILSVYYATCRAVANAILNPKKDSDLDDAQSRVDELQDLFNQPLSNRVRRELNRINNLTSFIEQYQNYKLNEGEGVDINYLVRQARTVTAGLRDPETKQMWGQVATEIRKKSKPSSSQVSVEVDRVLKEAGDALLLVKKESDIDPILQKVEKLLDDRNTRSYTPATQRSYQRAEAVVQVLALVQDYIGAAQSNDFNAMQNARQQLSYSAGRARLTERSKLNELLKKFSAPNQDDISETLASAKPADLEKIATGLKAAHGADYTPRGHDIRNLTADLTTLAYAQNALESGRAREAFTKSFQLGYNHSWMSPLRKIARELQVQTLSKLLGLSKGPVLKEGQSPEEFIFSEYKKALEDRDWEKTAFTLDILISSVPGIAADPLLGADLAACRAFLSGKRLEEAGQTGAAIEQYTLVLKQNGKNGPFKEAVERLKTLEKTTTPKEKPAAK